MDFASLGKLREGDHRAIMEFYELVKDQLMKMRYLFYLVTPKESSFERLEDVPDYITEVVPFFIVMMGLEQALLYRRGKKLMRINTTIASVSQGMLFELSKVLFGSFLISIYVWTYDNFAFVHLPWDSAWTWFFCLIGIDFIFYWFHRAAHEVHFLWAAHQVHHSSEDFFMASALRVSLIQHYINAIFYLPLALCVPPSMYWVHVKLNLIYQFWIHTEAVEKLGPLEYILNTPSHHRVHHGRNKYCIDTNYAGFLIIWDRMFGTFKAEKEEKISYGLVHNMETFDPFYIQCHHFLYLCKSFLRAEGIGNKLSVLFKGPGWEPGKPRLGNIQDIPEVDPSKPKYDPQIPLWCNVYAIVHFACAFGGYFQLVHAHSMYSQFMVTLWIAYLVLSLTSLGAILDNRSNAFVFEMIRCAMFFVLDNFVISPAWSSEHVGGIQVLLLKLYRIVFASSAILCCTLCLGLYPQKKVE